VRDVKRPRRAEVLARIVNEEAKTELMATFLRDITAASSKATVEFHWATWTAFHEAWFGPNVPALPLTTGKIFAVAACFKNGGYRAFRAFAGRARELHILAGHPWDEELDLARRKATMSVLRGLGVARQSAPFDLMAVLRVFEKGKVLHKDGAPVGWANLVVLATFFMMRELEIAAALATHLSVDEEVLRVTLRLPVSKTDARAAGCSRSWSCLCRNAVRRVDCPYHSAVDQIKILKGKFGNVLPLSLPLFPTASGDVVSKMGIVEALEANVEATGALIVAENGGKLLGGHSFRVTGAQRLAALGVEVAKIMVMARWAGESVLRYVREAPLETLPAEVVALEEQRNLVTTLRALHKEVRELGARIQNCEQGGEDKVSHLEERIAGIHRDLTHRAKAQPDLNVIARVGRNVEYKVHNAEGNDFGIPPTEWRTKCGRKFGHWTVTRHMSETEFPADARCRDCFGVAAGGPPGKGYGSSSSSSTSGES
jgi:hypothetical protein